MQEYKIIAEPQALQDVAIRFSYLLQQTLDFKYAEELIGELQEEIAKLRTLPYRNPLARNEQLRYKGVRLLTFKNYHIFYTVDEKRKIVYISC